MKSIFFDAGPIISLIMSRLVWLLPELKKKFGGKFYITPAVRKELVERPLQIQRFQFEALQVLKLIDEGVLELYKDVPMARVDKLISLGNSTFSVKGQKLDVMQSGEMESVACAVETGATLCMDERTLRLFIEKPERMEKLLESRFRHNVETDKNRLKNFQNELKDVSIIRSIELVAIAYRLGLLDSYIPKIEHGRETLIGSVLWATKYNGCAVTNHEVEEIKSILLKKAF
jgi:hypothetical protein